MTSGVISCPEVCPFITFYLFNKATDLFSTAIFLVILFARSQMMPVDIAALERLKYNYKGA